MKSLDTFGNKKPTSIGNKKPEYMGKSARLYLEITNGTGDTWMCGKLCENLKFEVTVTRT